MATANLSPGEEAQLKQTIEMFEVIVESQTGDTQSLEILKEAYSKLGREDDVVNTSKRIAEAYLHQGQLSSAILEFETVLQRRPEDSDVHRALKQIEDKSVFTMAQAAAETPPPSGDDPRSRASAPASAGSAGPAPAGEIDDGRKSLYKLFVDSKIISAGDFDLCWRSADMKAPPTDVQEPFIQRLHEKQICPIDKSLRLLSEKARVAYLPLDRYDIEIDLARGFPAEVCRRWCVLPFDRMSKSILVATANPYNAQAAKELAAVTPQRLLWYVSQPVDLINNLRKAFR